MQISISPGDVADYREGMEFDLETTHRNHAYKLLAGLVTPRPIALVTTSDAEGRVNAAPFSFFNVLGATPPTVGFCPGDRDDGTPKDTARNAREMGEFVVNLVDEGIAEQMVACAEELPHGESEIEHAGLTTKPSTAVKPPRIAEAPAAIECREWGTLQIGGNRLIIGLVLRIHTRDGVLDPETLRINTDAYPVVGRMYGPDGYCQTRDQFFLDRPG